MKDLGYLFKSLKNKDLDFFYSILKDLNYGSFDLERMIDKIVNHFHLHSNFLMLKANKDFKNLEVIYKQKKDIDEQEWTLMRRDILIEALANQKLFHHEGKHILPIYFKKYSYFLIFENIENRDMEDYAIPFMMIFSALKTCDMNYMMSQYAMMDPVVDAFNFHAFQQKLSAETSKIDRVAKDEVFSVILIDIKNFDNINDKYGYSVGDEVLRAVCDIIKSKLRKHDLTYRFGDDEFAVVASYATTKVAKEHILQRILEELDNKKVRIDGQAYPLEISAAIVEYKEGVKKSDFIEKLKKSLAEAKVTGEVVIADFK